jgi:hypothetical protein
VRLATHAVTVADRVCGLERAIGPARGGADPREAAMKITLADPSRLGSLLAYLHANGCIAYTDEQPWTITAVLHEGVDKSALMRIVAAWTAAEHSQSYELSD